MKKGFTLIELLAVIVILAIIAIIATPIVIKIINDSKLNAYKASINTVQKQVSLFLANEKFETEKIRIMCNGKTCSYKNKKIKIEGEVPRGVINIYKDGKTDLQLGNNLYCAVKNRTGSIKVYNEKCSEMPTLTVKPSFSITNGKGKITITTSLNAKEGINIDKYYYSLDGNNWIEKKQASYTFNDLEIEKTYTIYVKVKLSNGIELEESTNQRPTNNILNSNFYSDGTENQLEKKDISKVEFVDYIKEECNNEEVCWSVSTKGNIKAWKEEDRENPGLYIVYVGSSNIISLPQNSASFFSGFTNLKTIIFNNISTINVTTINQMFSGCSSLIELDLSSFYTRNVGGKYDMYGVFSGCSSLTKLDLSNFDTINVTDMTSMFSNCTLLIKIDLSSFNTTNVTTMNQMFSGCSSLIELDLNNFESNNLKTTHSMFSGCTKLKKIILNGFAKSKITDMSYMFSHCSLLEELDLNNFDTSNVTNMYCMFYNCDSLIKLDLSSFDTSNVTNMAYMFQNCKSLKELDLSSFNTTNVTNMYLMFCNCKSLTKLDLSSFNTINVTNMVEMFRLCSSLEELDLSSFNTTNVTNMQYMFRDCTKLKKLDLSNFDTTNVANMEYMFSECTNLKTIYIGSKWQTAPSSNYMFYNCGTNELIKK